ncbi:unnamed protein product [Rotaria sordida]|uniref:F-box domain-containing protein n=1 Tax=Rotaria sordida TaxID=392033 RepID=A0A814VJS3_9BILA|nr:unnamed protein product [Rotaria sordida]CAF3671135.1 unnamed protein product [Rotaria sordida]
MNRIKRQRNFRQSQTFKKKKTLSCIENLSNEIFYEIFDYLDGYNIYQAFSNLNIRLENLLISPALTMKIEISSKTKLDSHYYKQFIRSNKYHIISIDFDSQSSLNDFMNLFIIDTLFVRLESIILNSISTYKLLILLFYLKSLPNLSSLSICLTNCSCDIGHIYQMIFHLSLKYFRVAVPQHPLLSITIPIAVQDQYSSIEYLLIYHRCTFNQLTNILLHTPRLSHLYCFNIIESDDNIKFKLINKLNNLTHLTVTLRDIEFDEFENFLLKHCSQLELLNVKIYSMDEIYLDADRWEQLITQNITSLTKFIFRYSDTIDEDFQITYCHSLINRFISSFWIDRKWIFKLLIEDDELIYSIRPYQETWIDIQRYLYVKQGSKNNIDNSSNRYFSTVELDVTGNFLTENDEPLIKKINSIFNMIEITYLNIECEQITVSMLIIILDALRNLNSIRLSNSPLCQQMDLNIRDKNIFKKFLKINKITKITLRNVTEQDRIDFILKYFSRIEFFGLEIVRDRDLKSIINYLFKNIKHNNIYHPMTICVFCDDANYNKVEKLYQMINSKNLLNNYTIYRQYDRFYIQWK